MVYLIHFDKPLHHARHYIGSCHNRRLVERMQRHKRGGGSRLMRAVSRAGIEWHVVRTWPTMGRGFERWLKNQKNSRRYCPICNAE